MRALISNIMIQTPDFIDKHSLAMKMNLRHYLYLPIFLLIFLFVNSCQRPSKTTFVFIPETAYTVVTMHPGNLLEKGKLTELDFLKEGTSRSELAERIMNDPESSGIDMDNYSNFFLFGKDPSYGGFVVGVDNKKKFENTINDLELEADQEFERGKLGKYDLISLDAGIALYDNSVALILFSMGRWGDDLEEIAEKLINLEKEDQILSDKDFNRFLGKQKDINAWFTSTNIKGMGQLGDAMDLLGGLKNNYGHAFLEFKKGSVILTTNLRFNQSMEETIEKFNFLDKNAIHALLEYMPSKDLVFIGNTNVDSKKIIDLLKFINKDFNRVLEDMTKTLGMDEDAIRNAFSGEMAFSINGVNRFNFEDKDMDEDFDFEKDILVVTGATRMKNEILFRKFLDMAEEKGAVQEKNGYYMVKNKGIPAYMVLNNKDLVVSNKEETIKEITEKGRMEDNVTKAEYSEILTNNPICFYLNLDASSYSHEMQEFIDREMNEKLEMGLETFGASLKSLSFSANLEEWELRMDLNEDDNYSLYTLLREVDRL